MLPKCMGWHNPYFTEYHTGLSGTVDRNVYELDSRSCVLLMEVGSGSTFIPESCTYIETVVLVCECRLPGLTMALESPDSSCLVLPVGHWGTGKSVGIWCSEIIENVP